MISRSPEALTDDQESDQEFEMVGETDAERREALLTSNQDTDSTNKLGRIGSWRVLEQEFGFDNHDQATSSNVPIDDIIDLSSENDDDDSSGTTAFTHGHSSAAKDKGKSNSLKDLKENASKATQSKSNAMALGLGRMVEAEIDIRKKESLGMAPVKGGGRTLGSRSSGMKQNAQSTPKKWDCLVCTLFVTFCCYISLGVGLIRVLVVRISQVICPALLAAHLVENQPGHKESRKTLQSSISAVYGSRSSHDRKKRGRHQVDTCRHC